MEVQLHEFLTSAPDGCEWWAPLPGRFTPGERALGTHCVTDQVGPKVGVEVVAKRNKIPAAAKYQTPVVQIVA
jgi:hypothetical protein